MNTMPEVIEMNDALAAKFLPPRNAHAHKGYYGSTLLIGGIFSMQGALTMAAKSCFSSGCGLCTLFTPGASAAAIASKIDFAMIKPSGSLENLDFDLEADKELQQTLQKFDVIAAGCGLGLSAGAWNCVKSVLQTEKPVLLDADAINLCARHKAKLERNALTVLTPHLMEFSRLVQKDISEILQDPLACGYLWACENPQSILILKSDVTYVISIDHIYKIDAPTSALSKGGSGDLLAGICTSFLAQCKNQDNSAKTGALAAAVWIHNQAASLAKTPWTCTPQEVLENYPAVFERLAKIKEKSQSSL